MTEDELQKLVALAREVYTGVAHIETVINHGNSCLDEGTLTNAAYELLRKILDLKTQDST